MKKPKELATNTRRVRLEPGSEQRRTKLDVVQTTPSIAVQDKVKRELRNIKNFKTAFVRG